MLCWKVGADSVYRMIQYWNGKSNQHSGVAAFFH